MDVFERIGQLAKKNVRTVEGLSGLNFELSPFDFEYESPFCVRISIVEEVRDASKEMIVNDVKEIYGEGFSVGERIYVDVSDKFGTNWFNESFGILTLEFGEDLAKEAFGRFGFHRSDKIDGVSEIPVISYDEFVEKIKFVFGRNGWLSTTSGSGMEWSKPYLISTKSYFNSDKTEITELVYDLSDGYARVSVEEDGGPQSLTISQVVPKEKIIVEYFPTGEATTLYL